MLFKIFLYFLYIMNLSIYISVAYYLSKGYLAQVVSGWTPNLLGYCSGSDFRWPALTTRYIGEKSPIYRQMTEKSPISRDKCRNIARPIFLQEISLDRYFSKKYRTDTLRHTIFRWYIAEISRHFPPCLLLACVLGACTLYGRKVWIIFYSFKSRSNLILLTFWVLVEPLIWLSFQGGAHALLSGGLGLPPLQTTHIDWGICVPNALADHYNNKGPWPMKQMFEMFFCFLSNETNLLQKFVIFQNEKWKRLDI